MENKLIAEFMGLEWNSYERLKRNYSSDWRELMPVVEKIESLGNRSYGFTIDPWGIQVIEYASGNEEVIVSFTNDDNYPKIQQYYETIIEFIKWYNNSTKDGK